MQSTKMKLGIRKTVGKVESRLERGRGESGSASQKPLEMEDGESEEKEMIELEENPQRLKKRKIADENFNRFMCPTFSFFTLKPLDAYERAASTPNLQDTEIQSQKSKDCRCVIFPMWLMHKAMWASYITCKAENSQIYPLKEKDLQSHVHFLEQRHNQTIQENISDSSLNVGRKRSRVQRKYQSVFIFDTIWAIISSIKIYHR